MAKIRFFATYALSVLLILILASSFLTPEPEEEQEIPFTVQATDTNTDIYGMLHQQMVKLDEICSKVTSDRSAANLGLLQAEEAAFHTGIENIRIEAASMPDPKKALEMEKLIDIFSRTAAKQVDLTIRGASTSTTTGSSAEMNEMKEILLQKEQQIAQLEDQNRLLVEERDRSLTALQSRTGAPAPVVQSRADNDAAEWKRKYERLKADNDKLKESNNRILSQTNELKKSHKEVVDDNRRLLAQLQAARAGKN